MTEKMRKSIAQQVNPAASFRLPHRLIRLALFGFAGLALSACISPEGGGKNNSTAGVRGSAAKIGLAEPKSSLAKYLAGQIARSGRDTAAAARYYEGALRLDPQSDLLRNRTLILLLAEGKMARAIELARQSVEKKRDPSIARVALAVDAVRAGNWKAATEHVRAVPKSGLSSLVVPLLRAWIAAERVDRKAEEAALKAMPKRRSYALFAGYHRALMLQVAGQTVAAAKAAKDALAKGGKNAPRMVYTYISLLAENGDSEAAKKEARDYLGRFPGQPLVADAYRRLMAGTKPPGLIRDRRDGIAEIFLGTGRYLAREPSNESAKVYFRLALHVSQNDDQALVYLGDILEDEKRWAEAAAIYQRIAKTSPFSWRTRVRIANTLSERNKIDDAIGMLRQLSKERSGDTEALVTAGDILRIKDRFVEAASLYGNAIARVGTPQSFHWRLFYYRGIAHERAKQWDKAEVDFLKALQLKPEQPRVLNYLGYSWIDQGKNLRRARKMVERAVQQRPNDGYIVDSLGWALYRLGDFKGAVKHLERAVELLPQDPILNDHLGDAYWRIGRFAEARFQWSHALAFKPEVKEAAKIQMKLRHGLAAIEKKTGGNS